MIIVIIIVIIVIIRIVIVLIILNPITYCRLYVAQERLFATIAHPSGSQPLARPTTSRTLWWMNTLQC